MSEAIRRLEAEIVLRCGIGRVADNEKAICLYFDRKLTDDEMRELYDYILALAKAERK